MPSARRLEARRCHGDVRNDAPPPAAKKRQSFVDRLADAVEPKGPAVAHNDFWAGGRMANSVGAARKDNGAPMDNWGKDGKQFNAQDSSTWGPLFSFFVLLFLASFCVNDLSIHWAIMKAIMEF